MSIRISLRRCATVTAAGAMTLLLTALGPAHAASTGLGSSLTSLLGTTCSWKEQIGKPGINVYFPDTNATYWVTKYTASAGTGLAIHGSFPAARYFSFTAYNKSDTSQTANIYDAQIDPASGVNPFQPGQTGSGTYTLDVIAESAPADPAPNTLYVGTSGKITLVYRLYAPTDVSDPEGGVALPQITTTEDGQPVTTEGACVRPAADRGEGLAVRTTTRVEHRQSPPSGAPAWAPVTASGVYPNPNNAYLAATARRIPGRIVVLRLLAPSFPDTEAGAPPWEAGQQVRYWSICENAEMSRRVVACTADDQAIVDSGGYATFVVSPASDRPSNATAADGVNWLPWGDAEDSEILYRQELASPTFSQSIANAPASGSLTTTMGRYTPQVSYCTEATFERTGVRGCL